MRIIYTVVLSLFLSAVSFVPTHANALVCENKNQFVFSNGVFNTPDDAEDSRSILHDRMKLHVFDFVLEPTALAYASDGGSTFTLTGALPAMGQLLELFLQKTIVDNTNNFWHWISGTGGIPAPQWFLDGVNQIAAGINAANYVFDADLQEHVTMYQGFLNAGNRVLIVSHSQGNFYANAAHRILAQAGFGSNVGIVAVATPAGIVEGGGSHVTAAEDLIIRGVRILSLGFGVLPANISNSVNPPNADWFNHNFVNFYMAGVQTRYAIERGIGNLLRDAYPGGSNGVFFSVIPKIDYPGPLTPTRGFLGCATFFAAVY